MKKRVLVVAGEARLRATLAHAGALAGCRVELAERVDRARKVATNGGAALAIVAPAGLGAEGLGLARELSETSGALIVVAEGVEAVERLSRAVPGAAGYLCTPLKEAEVLARIRDVLHRQKEANSVEAGGSHQIVSFAGCVLDLAAHEFVNSAGEAVTLTRTEFALLSVLVRHPRTVLTRDRLRREVAGRGAEPYERSIDMLVARLRRKVERDARAPVLLVTMPGVGYKFGAIPEPAMKVVVGAPAAVFGSAQKSDAAQNAPRSAERKQLTVLCCNLADLSTLPSRGDPEELQAVMAAFHRCCAEVIGRFGGEVDTLLADGVLAYFGYPQVHEDDAERGIRAGLALTTAMSSLGRAPAIRIGIASGLVVVGELLGKGAVQEHSAVGEALVLAEQLQSLAAANEVVIAESTRRLAGGRFNYRDLGLAEAKGFSEPVHGWRVTGVSAAASRFEVRRGAGLSPLAGREDELKLLSRRWEQAAHGEGQVVALVGEPGVGKSRLVYEFTRSHHTQDWLLLEGASVSYGRASAYRPVIDLLKAYFGIEDRDDERTIREKLTGKLLALDEALKPDLVPLVALLEVAVDDAHWGSLDPAQKRLRTLDACKRLLLREAQVQPVTLVFEDLHWVDGETQALLDALVESLPTARLLLLTVYRPEYAHRWGSKTYYTQLRLDPLTGKNAHELLRTLLGTHPSVQPLFALLIERTEGNPLYLEESIRTLAETGELQGSRGAYRLSAALTSIRIPATVQAILAARIDRLAPADKRLLQAAAVIGKDVPHSLLQALAELPEEVVRQRLATLQAGEFLYEKMVFPDFEYTFKHALTQEVTYGSLLGDRRRQIHTQIVGAMERLYSDRLGEHVARLGQHALRGEAWEKAVLYLQQAGVKASDRSANREAVVWFEQALAALTHLPETRETIEQAIDLRVDLRNSFMPLSEVERMFESLREAEVLADKVDDPRRRSALSSLMAYALFARGNFEGALESARRALAIATSLKDLSLEVTANNYLAYPYWGLGDYRAAITVFQRNVVALQGDLLRERFGLAAPPSILSRVWLVLCLSELGEFGEGIARADESIRIAEMVDRGWALAMASWGVGYLHCRKGELDEAIAALERFVGECRHRDLPMLSPIAASLLGYAYVLSGRLSEALPLLEEAVEQTAAKGIMMLYIDWLGEGYLLAGRVDEATRLARRALELARELKGRGYEARALRLCGEVASRRDPPDVEQANTSYHQALTLAGDLEMRPLVAHCHIGLGKLYAKTGRREEAKERLAVGTAIYREMDMRFWLEKALAELTLLS